MDRAVWLKQMRVNAEALYDLIAPLYWVSYGLYENYTHLEFLRSFLQKIKPQGKILSAGCGAGRYDGLLLEAGFIILGIDQSEWMLERAREHFPQVQYEKMGLQDISFHEIFDGVTCIDAMEHICPEDYPHILLGFQHALKKDGRLYFTVDIADDNDLSKAFQQAQALGLPVVYGEVVDQVDTALTELQRQKQDEISIDLADAAVYHFYPALEQVRIWLDQAELVIEEERTGSGYHHFLVRK